jgi:hypothetical protein
MAGVAHCGLILLDSDDRATGSDGLRQDSREQAGAAIQVERRLAGSWLQRTKDRLGQHIGSSWMDLPEACRTHPPRPAGGTIGQEPRRAARPRSRVRMVNDAAFSRAPPVPDEQGAIAGTRRGSHLDPARA